jgi:Sulfatase
MTSNVQPMRETRDPSRYGLRALHVFILCGFAFTVPVLTALARQPVYIDDQQFGWTEIGVLLIGLTICLPLGFVLADGLALAISKRLRGWGRNSVLFVLFMLVFLSIIRPYASAPWIALTGLAGYLTVLLALAGAGLAVFLYQRFSGARLWLTIAAVGLVVFPGVFLQQFHSIRQSEWKADQIIAAKHPTPVIMIVFDEFNGTTLLNDRMEIDARHFPQFARLARLSTFYRNATTVHPRTPVAVPAILSGRFPVTDLPPLAAFYPGNLLQTIQATRAFDMTVFEPVTRLFVKSTHRRKSQQTPLRKTGGLIRTLWTIYLRLIITKDLPFELPPIPPEWDPVYNPDIFIADKHAYEERFNDPDLSNRPLQLALFLDSIKSSVRPRFSFLHVELPHVPWVFLPTGEQYVHESNCDHLTGAVGDLGEDWLIDPPTIERNEFRYRLQVGFVDRFIGRLLDRLAETNTLDKCLLIVTADHGVSLRPGHSRRLPDADNLADIASVPLFIKLPGQKAGRVDDRNVETIDIFPTIAESLGIELPDPVDGMPVSQEARRPRKTMYFEGTATDIEPDLPQRQAAVLRQFELFGHDDLDQLPAGIAAHPEWHGRPISSFVVAGKPVHATLIDALREQAPEAALFGIKGVATSRSFMKGNFKGSDLPETPAELLVAVDGIVRDSGRTSPWNGNEQEFEFLLTKSVLRNAADKVRLYLVNRSQTPPTLRPVSTSIENPSLDNR